MKKCILKIYKKACNDSGVLPARLLLPALLAVLLVPADLLAQTQPSASTLQQQIERDQQADKQRLQIKPPTQAPVEAPLVGQTVVVSGFKFKGNTLLSNEELSAALAPLLGRPLDFARLQSSPLVVADLYRDKGWVVQTSVPGQDIEHGVELYNRGCCVKCSDCDYAKEKRVENMWRECDGSTLSDTQKDHCAEKCHTGYYDNNKTGAEGKCIQCTRCKN